MSQAEGLQGASPDATCTCPSGDGSLVHPCPAHPASVEQAGGDERTAFEAWMTWLMDHVYGRLPDFTLDDGSGAHYVNADVSYAWTAWQARAALAQPSPGQAEAERPEVVAWRYGFSGGIVSDKACLDEWKSGGEYQSLMTVAQHERIVGALRAEIAEWQESAGRGRSDVVAYIAERAKLLEGRDAALARVAELEAKLSDPTAVHQWQFSNAWFDGSEEVVLKAGKEGSPIRTLYTAPPAQAQQLHDLDKQCRDDVARALGLRPSQERGFAWSYLLASIKSCVKASEDAAQAQHSVPAYVSYTTRPAESLAGIALRQLKDESRWVEIRDINAHAFPDMQSHSYYPAGTVIKLPAAAPGKEVPQAWLDVQAERRRQVEAEGWTPEHDDAHSYGQMARAAACYALAGSSAPNDGTAALLVSLAWPWDEQWWKPTTVRRDLVKACALALAEIERLDRAATGKEAV
ncbi:hypothetical protein DY981_22945 [Pseudomonas aeruginosa]|nr:hypothetical protein DY981_22945 [Pseudomonas aeruginosa]